MSDVITLSSNKKWEIREGDDGVIYCNCPSWKFQNVPPKNRRCKHVSEYMALRDKGLEMISNDEFTVGDSIDAAIDKALEDLKS